MLIGLVMIYMLISLNLYLVYFRVPSKAVITTSETNIRNQIQELKTSLLAPQWTPVSGQISPYETNVTENTKKNIPKIPVYGE